MILELAASEVVPEKMAVLQSLGMPPDITVPDHIDELYHEGLRLFVDSVAPIGILAEISTDQFGTVYHGEGLNDRKSVVGDVFPKAERLALFAVTLGGGTSRAITQGFDAKDYALASMLDAIASEGADLAAERTERRYEGQLRDGGWGGPDAGVLRYSPGYCGWDVTGQKKLFGYLEPEQIGLTLTESCLMQPLKSVSGVIIAGPKIIHKFSPTYSFCSTCETHACRERLRALRNR